MPLHAQESQPTTSIIKRALSWLRANLFSSVASTLVTLVLLYLVAYAAISLFQWGVEHAVWAVPDNQTQACRSVRGLGACWAVIREKYRFILFGTYPYEEQWRPALAIVLFVLLYWVSAVRWFWRAELALIWIAALTVIVWLMCVRPPTLSYAPPDPPSTFPAPF